MKLPVNGVGRPVFSVQQPVSRRQAGLWLPDERSHAEGCGKRKGLAEYRRRSLAQPGGSGMTQSDLAGKVLVTRQAVSGGKTG